MTSLFSFLPLADFRHRLIHGVLDFFQIDNGYDIERTTFACHLFPVLLFYF
jgi:hypothetical protein